MVRHALRTFHLVFLTLICSAAAFANGVPVIYQPLNLSAFAPGGSGFKLTVSGSGLTPSAIVNWNDSPRTTTSVSSSKLTVTIFVSDIASTAAGGGIPKQGRYRIGGDAGFDRASRLIHALR